MNCFFDLFCFIQCHLYPFISMKASSLRIVAGSTKLLRSHLLSVQSEFDKCNANKCDGSALPILALFNDIRAHCKMVIRIQQVQREKINKYRQSILNGRKVKRGEHAPTDMIMDVMIPMTLRFIQDLKDTLPELTQPIVTRIHSMLHDLHDRLSMFQMFVDTNTTNGERPCQCNSVGISCNACHQGAHEQCQHKCIE